MDSDTLDELCALGKLDLEPDERARLGEQLDRLLQHFEVLRTVDTDGIEPSPYPRPLALRTRPDEPGPCLRQGEVLQNAPARRAGHFLVPRIFET